MWTYAGWVHAMNKGWVKGYKLYPKFVQKKVKNKKNYKVKYKEVEDCKKVLVKD